MLKTLATLITAVAALSLPAPTASAQEPTLPRWLRQPMAASPPLAETLGFEGHVRLRCNVNSRAGSLTDCRATTEVPTELGFAEAAIVGARRARLAIPPPPEGASDPTVEFVIRFQFVDESRVDPPLAAGRTPAGRDLNRARAALAERPLPQNLFIPASGVPERWRAAHEQVLGEFDQSAREVWALVLARSRDRPEHARVLNAGPGSWPAHQSELQHWSFAHPEAEALHREMVDRMRTLVCAEIVCEP